MQILHYMFGVPPVREGGLPRYVFDLVAEQKKQGNTVWILIPGPVKRKKTRISIKYWKKINGIKIYQIVNAIPVSNGYGILSPKSFMPDADINIYSEWISKMKPEIVHVHSIMGVHKEFFEATKKLCIPIVYTTHDYFGLCPKIDLLCDNRFCGDEVWTNCSKCCENAHTVSKLKIKQTNWFRVLYKNKKFIDIANEFYILARERVRGLKKETESKYEESRDGRSNYDFLQLQHYYRDVFGLIDFYFFNSTQTREIYEQKLGALSGEVLFVTNSSVKECREKREYGHKKLRIAYLGGESKAKGFFYLIDELDKLYEEEKLFELNTYIENIGIQREYIRNHSRYNAKNQDKVYESMDILVVPSLWKETFGMVVIEALSHGVPVIVSENVGAKDILKKNENIGISFIPLKGELSRHISVLCDDRKKLFCMNENILCADIDLQEDKHAERIVKAYHRVIELDY